MRSTVTLYVLIFFGVIPAFSQDAIPFRDAKTYEFKLNYDFKAKPPASHNEISFVEQGNTSPEYLPYVKVNIKMLSLADQDYRVRVVDGHGQQRLNKKAREDMDVDINMGFAEDLKEDIVPNIYHVYFINKEKEILSKISVKVTSEGDLLLNGQQYGKL